MSVVSPPDKSRIMEVDTDSMIYSAAASMSASEKETISLAQASPSPLSAAFQQLQHIAGFLLIKHASKQKRQKSAYSLAVSSNIFMRLIQPRMDHSAIGVCSNHVVR